MIATTMGGKTIGTRNEVRSAFISGVLMLRSNATTRPNRS